MFGILARCFLTATRTTTERDPVLRCEMPRLRRAREELPFQPGGDRQRRADD